MSLLVVGSVAFDAIETPHGKVDRALGGAASYFALAASHFTRRSRGGDCRRGFYGKRPRPSFAAGALILPVWSRCRGRASSGPAATART